MHLIIQGAQIATGDLKALAKAANASAIEQISSSAFRLRNAQPAADIAALCETSRLDFAFIPEDRRLSDFKLLVMDMDSTLITIETIDELADMNGVKREVATITAQAMRGEIEYDESLRTVWNCSKGWTSARWRAKPVVRDKTMHALNYAGLDGVLNLFN